MKTDLTQKTFPIKKIISTVFLGMFLLQITNAFAAQRIALPIDEAKKDQSFASFRAKLIEAIVRRDVDYVVSQASKDVHLSFGGHSGRKSFRGFLTLTEANLADEYKHEAATRRESYWNALEEVLRMGGRFKKAGVFGAPYTWTIKLLETEDAFTTYFVIGDKVALRNRPSKFGEIIATLNHNIVKSLKGGDGTPFIKVKLSNGNTGFVKKSQLRSAVDYRAIFEKRSGHWQLVTFIAGD